ncbi:MAG: PQQ-dependent sugar dehydrogenase [Spirochaetaceae bacterium]|nr:MAG: PQQ-dependent sugar dehydrogenase [Spirochaetaceae bacterium]
MTKTVIMIMAAVLPGLFVPAPDVSAQGRMLSRSEAHEAGTLRIEQVARGLENPWALTPLPDGRMLVTERPGRMHTFDGSTLTPVDGLPGVAPMGQGGLLDVIAHPRFSRNGLIFITYSEPGNGGAGTAVARARLQGNSLREVETIFSLEPKTGRGQHFGSRLAFLPDETLLLTIGDRGWPDSAQDTMDHAGSTLRLNIDGTVPEDNPFLDRDGYRPELYTIGNRNSQGMTVHPETGTVWQSEHGPRGGDELNIIEPGLNYGWPRISHGVDYRTGRPIGEGTHAPGLEQPREHWSPAIAPSGIAFYFGDAFPEWEGNLFVASLVARHLRRLVIEEDQVVHQEVLLDGTIGRIRDVTVGSDGYLYVINDERDAGIFRIRPD